MVRTQIQLTQEQHDRACAAARAQGVSMAEYVRRALDNTLALDGGAEARKRALEFAGCFSSGLGDLAENHDKYLAEAYAE